MNVKLDIEKIRELTKQYKKFNESNKKIYDMLLTEKVEENWEDNYHLIDHDWIINRKNTISFDELDKQNSDGDENSICKFLQENIKSNNLENLNNIGIYCLKGQNNYLDPMKTFDIISDEVWRLFHSKNENDKYNGKVSLLKGNRKILIHIDENIYYIKYLTNLDKILFGEFVIIFNSEEIGEKNIILKDLAKSNIYDWMKKNDFNPNEKIFKINKYKIPFDIEQKTNNYYNQKMSFSFDVERDCCKDANKYASFSKASYSFPYSFYNNNSNNNFLDSIEFSSFFSEIENFRIIQKYDQTTNVCSIMRYLSLISPFAVYFTNKFKDNTVFSKFQSKSLLNLIRDFFINLFENIKTPYAPKDFTEYIQKKTKINIKEEQDPFIFLDYLMKYINKRLDRFDTDIEYHFNDILDKIKKELYNDIEKILNKNNSIIGKYFLGIKLEAYKCDKCNKIIERKIPFNILDIDYKGIVNELQNKDISIVGFNIDNLLEYYFLLKKIENKEKTIIDCPECENKLIIIGRKIIDYPEYLIIRLNKGKFNEKDGFEENESFAINYENIENFEIYSSEKITNEKINSKKYVIVNMVNSYKDKNIRFLCICKSPYGPKNKEIWIKFKCNEPPSRLNGGFKEDEESDPYILFYKLENKKNK